MNRRRILQRLLSLTVLTLLAVVLVACGGGGDDEEPLPSGTVPAGPDGDAPSATPFAQAPEPTIVTGEGTGAGNGEPGGSNSDTMYTVEAGDTLGAIAGRFGVAIDDIRTANDLTGDDIFVGQELTIPRGSGAEEPEATSTPGATGTPGATSTPGTTATAPPSGGGNVHVVESGDTPFGIALQYDVTLEELEAANGGPFGVLQIGQEIIIP